MRHSGEYRDLIGDGHSGPQATDLLLKEWAAQEDKHEWAVFWLALAATQWKCGRLEQRVKEKALEVIENASDLERWEEQRLTHKRAIVLGKLKQQILSAQPPEKKIPKRFRDSCDWKIGEYIGYRLKSGRWIVFRVTGYHTDKGGVSPTLELLRFVGDEIPKPKQLNTLSVWKWEDPPERSQLTLGRSNEEELPIDRVKRLGLKGRPELRPHEPIAIDGRTIYKCLDSFVSWRFLDKVLKKDLQLE